MDKEQYIEVVKKQYLKVDKANDELVRLWYENNFLQWEWWLGLVLTLLPWLIWLKLRPKESTDRLLYVGLFIIIISCWLDFVGVTLGLWYYPYKVLPTIPSYAPYDMSLLPVTVMLLLQYKQHISPYIKAIFFALLASFVGEPFFRWVNLYGEIQWNSFYSFPCYIFLYLFAYWLSQRNGFVPFLKNQD